MIIITGLYFTTLIIRTVSRLIHSIHKCARVVYCCYLFLTNIKHSQAEVQLHVEEPGTVLVGSLHLLRVLKGHGTLVAEVSERVVMVAAFLADPVAASVGGRVHAVSGHLLVSLDLTVDLGLSLERLLLVSGHAHVLRLAFNVVLALGLLASVAALAALEVVVLTLGALPAAIREVEGRLPGIIDRSLHGSNQSGQERLAHIEIGRDKFAGLFRHNGIG
jgi:hypothetical protein